jgi:protein-tyrosine kinase
MAPSSAKVVTMSDPGHRISRQFMDCACVLFKPHARWPRVVAVCSPGPGDGKTFVATNLAAALAISSRETTILVDANLRAPELHNIFERPREGGLAEALEGGAIQVHPLACAAPCDLQLLTSGHVQRHGAVLLGSTRFREMMDKITYQGNKPRIILDTPPLQGGADVDVLLDGVDGVLLVVRRGHTEIAEVERAIRRIPSNKLLGIVFNGRKRG